MVNKQTMKILAIIPAKLDSTRLKNKNIRELNGKPMFLHSVEYADSSNYDVDTIVSSESDIIKELCNKHRIKFLKRPKHLCGDTEVVDVYEYIINNQLNNQYDIVVGLQPDNPNRVNTFDECIDYMVDNKYDDLITIDEDYRRSGAMRLFNYKFLKEGKVSYRIGCIKETASDIHTEQDLNKVKKLYNE
jgi:CMP-N-acetylneuraminic acid synthetase